MPEVRLEPELARLVDARLASGQTWSSLVREALEAHLATGAPRKRSRRRPAGPVLKALNAALAAANFEERDAGAIGLARHLAQGLDERPADTKYTAGRLLSTLVEMRLTPAARIGILSGATEPKEIPSALERLRLISAARKAGETGIVMYLSYRDLARADYERYVQGEGACGYDEVQSLVTTATRALDALVVGS